MSPLGHQRHFWRTSRSSALPPIATTQQTSEIAGFVAKSDLFANLRTWWVEAQACQPALALQDAAGIDADLAKRVRCQATSPKLAAVNLIPSIFGTAQFMRQLKAQQKRERFSTVAWLSRVSVRSGGVPSASEGYAGGAPEIGRAHV